MQTFHLVSLGCAKNLVDSEVILGSMTRQGYVLVEQAEEADYLLVNTCGFIQPAVEEAIAEILALGEIKRRYGDKSLVVIGCLVERYKEQLLDELPEVDLFVGTESAADIAAFISDRPKQQGRLIFAPRGLMSSNSPRIITTPSFRAWLKITEGCDNRCSYCMIPAIRGNLRSRSIEDLVLEAAELERRGVVELSLIGQDITAYGRDGGATGGLVNLLTALLDKTSIPWFRLLYLYPSGIDHELIQLMVENPRIVPYLDLPLQHVSDRILQAMNRHYSAETVYQVIDGLRSKLPDVALRTTFLVGFPGEREKDFLAIEQFMEKMELDHVGVFAYANEEGAPSEKMAEQVEHREKIRRRDHLLELQMKISTRLQQRYVDTIQTVLVEGLSTETDLLLEGRTRYQAPEVDGCVFINDGIAAPGDLVDVRITEAQIYDLVGEIVKRD